MNKQPCRICENTENHTDFSFRDFHFGNDRAYRYFLCGSCSCLQKTDLFEEHLQYYPDNYYSYAVDDRSTVASKLKWYLRDIRNNYYRTGKGTLGGIIHYFLPCMSVAMIEKMQPATSLKVLDIGCGSDALMLQHLSRAGFTDISGVDPYIKKEIRIGAATIYKKSVFDLDGTFDIITLNHSFEHMAGQHETIAHCKKLLSENGTIMLRIPTVSSQAWEDFKEFWPNLDAPRHLFLHSLKSISHLVESHDLTITQTLWDSTSFQFWGAQLYKKGFALHQTTPFFKYRKALYRLYYTVAKHGAVNRLNNTGKGDTVALFLRHKP